MKGHRHMPNAQTEQWSWILQTVWGWIWGGLSWIIDWQAYVFRMVLSGGSFWEVAGKGPLLFFPTVVLVGGVVGPVLLPFSLSVRLRHTAPLTAALVVDLVGPAPAAVV